MARFSFSGDGYGIGTGTDNYDPEAQDGELFGLQFFSPLIIQAERSNEIFENEPLRIALSRCYEHGFNPE